MEPGGDWCSVGHSDRGKHREDKPRRKANKLQICCKKFHGEYPQEHPFKALLGSGSNPALRGDCKPGEI